MQIEFRFKIGEHGNITIGNPVMLFGRERIPVGIVHGAIAFQTVNPSERDLELLCYLPTELEEFAEEGNLTGLDK